MRRLSKMRTFDISASSRSSSISKSSTVSSKKEERKLVFSGIKSTVAPRSWSGVLFMSEMQCGANEIVYIRVCCDVQYMNRRICNSAVSASVWQTIILFNRGDYLFAYVDWNIWKLISEHVSTQKHATSKESNTTLAFWIYLLECHALNFQQHEFIILYTPFLKCWSVEIPLQVFVDWRKLEAWSRMRKLPEEETIHLLSPPCSYRKWVALQRRTGFSSNEINILINLPKGKVQH